VLRPRFDAISEEVFAGLGEFKFCRRNSSRRCSIKFLTSDDDAIDSTPKGRFVLMISTEMERGEFLQQDTGRRSEQTAEDRDGAKDNDERAGDAIDEIEPLGAKEGAEDVGERGE
jgi:hypothetical protein